LLGKKKIGKRAVSIQRPWKANGQPRKAGAQPVPGGEHFGESQGRKIKALLISAAGSAKGGHGRRTGKGAQGGQYEERLEQRESKKLIRAGLTLGPEREKI